MKGKTGTSMQYKEVSPSSRLLQKIATNVIAKEQIKNKEKRDYSRKITYGANVNRDISDEAVLQIRSLIEFHGWKKRHIIEVFDITENTYRNIRRYANYGNLTPTKKNGADFLKKHGL